MEKRYLTIKECSEYTALSVTTLYRWAENGEIPSHKLKRILRFDIREIDRWFSKFKQKGLRQENIVEDTKNGLPASTSIPEGIIYNNEIRGSGNPEKGEEK